jgi:flavin reductase (DIM6/NTAB) family NADH-FMN oxidoreductase RutF
VAKEPVASISTTPVLELLPPYPIVLVTTRTNVLTIGQLHYFTFSPLRLGIAVAHSRHTWALLKAEGEFVVNVPTEGQLEAVRACGRLSGRDGDKFAEAGLTPVPSAAVAAVSVAECAAHIECRVTHEVDFEERTWFVGVVVAASRAPGHDGAKALMCGRRDYRLCGPCIAPR